MSEKFTQGEWRRADLTSRNGKTIRGESFCRVVCGNHAVAYAYTCKTRAEQKANACLISAAPGMYRLLEQLHGTLESVPILQSEIETVLKKARGEQ